MLLVALTWVSCGNDEPTPPPVAPEGYYSVLTEGTNYETTTEQYYRFDLGEGRTAAESYINFYNFKFDPRMPITITMRINLAKATIAKTADGYTVTCEEEIVPDLYRGGVYTPYAERPVSQLTLTIDKKKMTYAISFYCSGMTFTDSGSIIKQ